MIKSWLFIGFVSLGGLLTSCQPDESTTPPGNAPTKGGWVIYPPLSALDASQSNHLPKADSIRAAQLEIR